MPYQNDARVGQSIADYLKGLYASPLTSVTRADYVANRNDVLMDQALTLDISDRIVLGEEVTGLGTGTEWFINGCDFELVAGGILRVSYTVAPADTSAYWILGTSRFGIDTRLGV